MMLRLPHYEVGRQIAPYAAPMRPCRRSVPTSRRSTSCSWARLVRCGARWPSGLGPDLSPHDARALRVIGHHGPTRLGVVAEHLRIAPRSATDVVDRLESRGLVHRTPDPDDRRAMTVR